jgi:hypothetical protein
MHFYAILNSIKLAYGYNKFLSAYETDSKYIFYSAQVRGAPLMIPQY